MHFEVKRTFGTHFVRTPNSPVYGRYYPEEKRACIIPTVMYDTLREGGFSVEKCYAGFKERKYIEGKQKKTRLGKDNPKMIIAYMDLQLDMYGEPREEDLPQDRYPSDRYPPDECPQNRYPLDECPQDRYPQDRYPFDDYPPEIDSVNYGLESDYASVNSNPTDSDPDDEPAFADD